MISKLMKTFVSFVLLLIFSCPSYAFSFDEGTNEKTMTIEDYIQDYVDIPEGGTDWKLFGATKEIKVETKTDDGFDLIYSKPQFQPSVENLNGKEIILKGYMFPLDETEGQKRFLFGPFPLSCPFQYHVGPSLVVEVHADKNPVFFDYEPITIAGTLELVPEDKEYSVFYRLKDARAVK